MVTDIGTAQLTHSHTGTHPLNMAPSGQGQDMKPELEAEVGTEMAFELTYASSMYCCYYYSVCMCASVRVCCLYVVFVDVTVVFL